MDRINECLGKGNSIYQQQPVNEKDWKLFRKRLPNWQEAYMAKLIKEYIDMLSDDKENPSERFWALEKRIKSDKRDVGVCAEMSRSKMRGNLIALIEEGAVTFDDLEGFSEDLVEGLKFLFRDRMEEKDNNE